MTTSESPHVLLRQHRRHVRGAMLLWAVASTLGCVALVAAEHLHWFANAAPWVLAGCLLALTLLTVWFVRAGRLTRTHLARQLDERWDLQARLESAVEVDGRADVWSQTIHGDAGRALIGRRSPAALWWMGAAAATALVLLLLTFEGAMIVAPLLLTAKPPTTTSTTTAASAQPSVPTTRATLEWRSPDPEIKAGAIEEVPTSAIVDSSTGFRSMALEMTVNGTRTVTQPLDAATLATLAKPGAHELAASVYLDELQVKPYDIVGYRLVAELDGPGPKQTAASIPQLIEIRPPRQDASRVGKGSEIVARLFQAKSDQIRLIKQNATLGNLHLGAASDPTWGAENDRVASEQAELAKRVDGLLADTADRAPALVRTNLRAASAAMNTASGSIRQGDNSGANAPQTRALALLTELEQFIGRAMSSDSPSGSDPIADQQSYRLPDRAGTPAGKLEQLAARAAAAADQVQQAASSSPDQSAAAAAEQAAISRDAHAMAASGEYADDVGQSLAAGSAAAADAGRQIQANDLEAARVPAIAAHQALQTALERQEKAGRENAVAALEELRRKLNEASRLPAAEREAAITAVRQRLAATATDQQRAGSAEAAQQLAHLADLLKPGSRSDASTQAAAAAAAHSQVLLSSRTAASSRVVRQLERAGAPAPAERTRPGGPPAKTDVAALELVGQEAAWLTNDTTVARQAEALTNLLGDAQRAGTISPQTWTEIQRTSETLLTLLRAGRDTPNPLARRFGPADVDPLYREAIDQYFERLSRDTRQPASSAAK